MILWSTWITYRISVTDLLPRVYEASQWLNNLAHEFPRLDISSFHLKEIYYFNSYTLLITISVGAVYYFLTFQFSVTFQSFFNFTFHLILSSLSPHSPASIYLHLFFCSFSYVIPLHRLSDWPYFRFPLPVRVKRCSLISFFSSLPFLKHLSVLSRYIFLL